MMKQLAGGKLCIVFEVFIIMYYIVNSSNFGFQIVIITQIYIYIYIYKMYVRACVHMHAYKCTVYTINDMF